MEAKENKETEDSKQTLESGMMKHRYQEYISRMIDSACEKVFSFKKIEEHLPSDVSSRNKGHLTIVAQQLKAHTRKVLGEKIDVKIEELKTHEVDHQIFLQKNCKDIDDEDFDEEEEYMRQTSEALGKEIERLKKMREQQNRFDPL